MSALLIVPCFWHRHLEAGDLGSHVYNAWLAQEIDEGRAPGLSLARPWQNVLFDVCLDGLGRLVGLPAAERLCAAASVLLFFWSLVALMAAVGGRLPWRLVPCAAMVAYGWTFHTGLFNYYIACALAFLGLAVFWNGTPARRIAVLALSPLVVLAQPAGFVWLAGASALILISERIPARAWWVLPIGAAVVLLLVRTYLASRFRILEPDPLAYLVNGTDQIAVFGTRYQVLAGAVMALGLAGLAVEGVKRRRVQDFWRGCGPPLLLYLCAQAAVLLLPGAVILPRYGAPFSMIQERVSLISAAMACCVLASIRPMRWQAAGFGAAALAFFVFLYQDTGALSRMEERVGELVRTLPPGSRVLETISTNPDWRPYVADHMVDRACVGHCYAYGNYEPSSRQFRVQASPGNGIVMHSYDDTEAMERGTYRVKPLDLPAWQIYQCSGDVMDLCIRALSAGETNNRLGMHPEGVPH